MQLRAVIISLWRDVDSLRSPIGAKLSCVMRMRMKSWSLVDQLIFGWSSVQHRSYATVISWVQFNECQVESEEGSRPRTSSIHLLPQMLPGHLSSSKSLFSAQDSGVSCVSNMPGLCQTVQQCGHLFAAFLKSSGSNEQGRGMAEVYHRVRDDCGMSLSSCRTPTVHWSVCMILYSWSWGIDKSQNGQWSRKTRRLYVTKNNP